MKTNLISKLFKKKETEFPKLVVNPAKAIEQYNQFESYSKRNLTNPRDKDQYSPNEFFWNELSKEGKDIQNLNAKDVYDPNKNSWEILEKQKVNYSLSGDNTITPNIGKVQLDEVEAERIIPEKVEIILTKMETPGYNKILAGNALGYLVENFEEWVPNKAKETYQKFQEMLNWNEFRQFYLKFKY